MAKRVLILHDDPEARSEYRTILWYNGFDVETADDPEQARRVAEMHAPDLVLLGISGESTRGFEVCRQLSGLTGAGIPVVLLSPHLDSDRARAARRAGCASYLEEPIPAVEVLFAVERLIGRSMPEDARDGALPPAPDAAAEPPATAPPADDPTEPAPPTLQVVMAPPAPPLRAVESGPVPPAAEVVELLPPLRVVESPPAPDAAAEPPAPPTAEVVPPPPLPLRVVESPPAPTAADATPLPPPTEPGARMAPPDPLPPGEPPPA